MINVTSVAVVQPPPFSVENLESISKKIDPIGILEISKNLSSKKNKIPNFDPFFLDRKYESFSFFIQSTYQFVITLIKG